MKNLKKKGKILSIAKGCEVEVSLQEDGFKGSWFRAILEKNPTRVKGEKLRVCYKTLLHEDGVNPCKETIERCFIRPVPPECLNEGVVFKEGSVVDAYFNNGLWTGVIVVERPDGSFFVYFDDPPDTMIFIRSQLRPHADWIGSKWVKSKNKVLSQHMFRTGKLVEMTREISESEKEKIWVRALVITEIQGGDRRIFLIKRCTSSQNLSDEAEGKHSIVDICKISPSPPRDLCVEYSLNDFVEVVVAHEWRKGRVTEILIENNYKVYFDATKEDAVFNYTEIRLSMEWLGGGSWIRARKREFGNNAVTPIRSSQESPSNTLVLESNEDDSVNDDATEITSSRESHNNIYVLEATETETQNHETVDGVELPLSHESDDMMDDVATPIITGPFIVFLRSRLFLYKSTTASFDLFLYSAVLHFFDYKNLLFTGGLQLPSISLNAGETMSKSDDKFALPKRISEPGTNGGVLDRINKRSNLKLVGTVENVLGREFKKLEDSFLAPGLWFSFGEQLMRFSLREFHLETSLPCVVDKDEEEVETSARKNKKKDPWMKKNQTLNTLLNLLVKKSTKLTADHILRLGATILVEGILMASNPVTSIPEERNLAFDYLRKEVESFTYTKLTNKDQYAICGFIYPLQLWALSSVNQLGTFFGIRDDEIQFPLCLNWIETNSLTIEEVNKFDKMEKVDVKCILGDPELHSDLVEYVDTEVDENNSAPGIDATDQEKINYSLRR
ncbi:unnamed protein product [Brassica oleracea]